MESTEHLKVVLNVLLRARWAIESKFVSGANAHVVLCLAARRGNTICHLLVWAMSK
jgi:hypothetical protein